MKPLQLYPQSAFKLPQILYKSHVNLLQLRLWFAMKPLQICGISSLIVKDRMLDVRLSPQSRVSPARSLRARRGQLRAPPRDPLAEIRVNLTASPNFDYWAL